MGRTKLRQRRGATEVELKYALWDVNVGMLASNLVAYFIILATAATLFRAGKHDIGSAAEAAQALRPFLGDAAGIIFAVGLIGTGFLAVPVLTGSAAYALAESFGWKYGLDTKPGRAKQFYAAIAIETAIAIAINFLGINPIAALYWTAVINGVVAPPLLLLILLIANDRRVMGQRVNGVWTNLLGGATTLVMFLAAIGMVLTGGGGS